VAARAPTLVVQPPSRRVFRTPSRKTLSPVHTRLYCSEVPFQKRLAGFCPALVVLKICGRPRPFTFLVRHGFLFPFSQFIANHPPLAGPPFQMATTYGFLCCPFSYYFFPPLLEAFFSPLPFRLRSRLFSLFFYSFFPGLADSFHASVSLGTFPFRNRPPLQFQFRFPVRGAGSLFFNRRHPTACLPNC